MLGSPASGLLAEWIISVVLKALPESTRVVCSADNVIVFVRTRKEAMGVKQALTRSLAQGPAGSLTFGTKEVVRLTDGFEFLGYDFLTRRGVPTAVPTDENHRIILGRFHQRMKRRQYDKAQKCVEQWAAQFNLWPAMDDWTHHMLTNVDIAEAGYWESPDAIPRQGARPGEPLGADSPAGGEQPPRNFKSGA